MPERPDATQRFTDRVEDYVRYRPGYPETVWQLLADEAGLQAGLTVADIGSGTGISAKLFLSRGCRVYAVEPNAAMRGAAEASLEGESRFISVAGTAEATGLPPDSVDFVTAAQAFHWFDPPKARVEFDRILKPGGWVVLLWNSRRNDASPFMKAYEQLVLALATDYARVRHENVSGAELGEFFGGFYQSRRLPNEQVFDFAGLQGRLLSSSYMPSAGHPRHEEMLGALRKVFDAHQDHGRVQFLYDTEVHYGRLGQDMQ